MREGKKFRKKNYSMVFFLVTLSVNLSLTITGLSQAHGADPDLTLPLQQCWSNKIISNTDTDYSIASDNTKDVGKIDADNFLFSQSNRSLEYVNGSNGHRLWVTDLGGETVSKPSITGEEIFLVVRFGENYFLRSISKITGIIIWQAKLALPAVNKDEIFLRLVANKIIIISQSGDSFALSIKNGSVIWQTHIATRLSAVPAFGKEIIAVGNESNRLLIISVADGSMMGEYQATSPITAIIFQTSDQLVAGDKKGNVFALNLTTGDKLWKIRNGAEISNINQSKAGLLVSSLDNFVYLVSPKSGKILWKKRFPGRIFYKPLLLDKYAVITNLSDSDAVFIDLKSGKIVNRIVFEEGNYFTNNILLEGNLLVFSNLRAVTAYSLTPNGCQGS